MSATIQQLAEALRAAKDNVYLDYAAAFFTTTNLFLLPGSSSAAFDLASLTKALATAALIQEACQQGDLAMAEPINDLFPALEHPVLLQQLLRHRAGMIPVDHNALGAPCRLPSERLNAVQKRAGRWAEEAPETQTRYSDTGYMLAGIVLEQRYEKPLSQLFAEDCAQPELAFEPVNKPWSLPVPALPNGADNGQVADPAAAWLNGEAGHAGLWGSASGVAGRLQQLLQHKKEDLQDWSFWQAHKGDRFTCGLDTPTGISTAGTNHPIDAVGHLGYTGCSFWMSPSLRGGSVLLTNRTAVDGSVAELNRLRRLCHGTGWLWLTQATDPA